MPNNLPLASMSLWIRDGPHRGNPIRSLKHSKSRLWQLRTSKVDILPSGRTDERELIWMHSHDYTVFGVQLAGPLWKSAIDESPYEGKWCGCCELGTWEIAKRVEEEVVD